MEDISREHIGTAELAGLLEELRTRPEPVMDARKVHTHLASCRSCREQFEGLALLDRQLTSMRPEGPTLHQEGCSGPELWREVAGGLTPPEETLGRIEHASRCSHCGQLLHRAVAELAALNGEMTDAERKHIATLVSARAEWQSSLAERITATRPLNQGQESPTWWQRQFALPRLAVAAACLLTVVGVGAWFAIQSNQPAAASYLLARAYTEKRTLELRIAGAGYAPVRVSRGGDASFTSRPSALLKAEALIASNLESRPPDPAWLQAQAEADVLEGRYDAAVEALHRALELNPGAPVLLTDLATAHFQRALEQERKDDFDSAFEYLSQALTLRPDAPVALFNRAIVSEHQFLYQQALDDWEHYLRLDSGSQWADEARNRAKAVREKVKQHSRRATPLLVPLEVARRITNPSFGSEVDERIEEYLHEAIRSWLPKAFPEARVREAPAKTESSPLRALFFLANLTSQRHGDRWLADLLSRSSVPHFPQAVAALALSVQANDVGEYVVSRQQADLAERWFRASGNMAGVVRAQFERTFASHITRQSDACRRQATAALVESERSSYPWVQIQLGLENGVCSGLMNDVGVYESSVHAAMEQAQKKAYSALYLRALGFAAEIQFDSGNYSSGSKLVNLGLERYWSAQYPVMRGYNLYSEVAHKAAVTGQSNLEMAVWREAAALIDSGEDPLVRAVAHRSLANAAIVAHQPQLAEQQYAEAARLFALTARTDASRSSAIENEILIAQIETRLGRFDAAVTRLTAIQDQIRALSDNYLVQMFYTTLGEMELGRQRDPEAERALRPALVLAERSLATLSSEEERTQWRKNAAPAYLALSEAALVQGRSQDALEMFEWYLGAPRRQSTTSHPPRASIDPPKPGASQLESRLPLLAKETVIAYAALPDGLAIWVYDDRGINSRWIPTPTDGLHALAERFHELSSDPKSELSALRRDARSLYAALIAPIEQNLVPGRTLVIEAEDWLARVPFEALIDSSDHYIVERGPVVYSLGQESQAPPRSDIGISSGLKALVVGSTASSPAQGLIPLPDVAAEADTVASGFHPVRVLKGREATLSAVRSELKDVAVFHFAGHSLATPEGTGLMLEDETGRANRPHLLDASALRLLPLHSLQLAVLSACSTGPGSGSSSGFNSVTDALLRAGVPHVVASRWAVDSSASRKFVEDFYSNLLAGEPVSQAIRLTSRRMLVNPETSHPYYWSAFAAYGER